MRRSSRRRYPLARVPDPNIDPNPRPEGEMATRTQPALLEREAELDELGSALAAAGRGEGRLVLVEGDAGIGKSRLLDAASDAARRGGMQVLNCRGTELERDFPFGLVAQLFGPALRALDDGERGEVLDEAAQPAGPIVGVQPATAGADEAGDPSFQALNALFWLTSNLAERTPLLLAVDDAQWSDQASLRFLAFLLPRLGDLPVALAVAVRTGESASEAGLLEQLSSDPVAVVLRPAPLSRDSVAELVRRDLAGDASSRFCTACEEASGGNPFMLSELLRALRADRSLGADAEAPEVRKLAPQSIQRSVLARLARLTADARGLARATAVLGDDAEVRDAAELAGLDAPAAGRAADALESAGILEKGRPLRFVHPLLRNAVEADLSGAERNELHGRAATQLLHRGADPERVAVHILATDPAADPRLTETLAAAAQRALGQGAPEAAASYARRALAEPAPPAARPGLLRTLLTASFRSLDQGAVTELDAGLLEELTADPEALYGVAVDLGPLLLLSGRDEEGRGLLERAKAVAAEAGDYDRAVTFEAQLDAWAHSTKTISDWDRFEGRPGPAGERIRLAMKAYAGARSNEPAENVGEWATRSVAGGAIFREMHDAAIPVLPIWVLFWTDRLDEAEAAIDGYSRTATSMGPAPVLASLFMRGSLAQARGRIAAAEPEMRDAVQGARDAGWASFASDWLGQLIEVLIEREALEEAETTLNAAGLAGALPDRIGVSRALHARGQLRLAQGRSAEAIADLTELSGRLERFGWINPIYPTDALAAIALAGTGELEDARTRADRYRRAAEHWGLPRARGIALRTLGLVEGGEQGIESLHEAVATFRETPARLELAKALTDLGSALRRAKQRAAAREPLHEALEIARRGGALATAKRAHDELEATGEKLRPLMAGGVESLTPSERRVASLAAQGRTNRAIAQELYLTVKTIEAHLSSAYRKLEIASRSELPEALGEVA
jgi:DNA-binding CsgD family transcriptional regulator